MAADDAQVIHVLVGDVLGGVLADQLGAHSHAAVLAGDGLKLVAALLVRAVAAGVLDLADDVGLGLGVGVGALVHVAALRANAVLVVVRQRRDADTLRGLADGPSAILAVDLRDHALAVGFVGGVGAGVERGLRTLEVDVGHGGGVSAGGAVVHVAAILADVVVVEVVVEQHGFAGGDDLVLDQLAAILAVDAAGQHGRRLVHQPVADVLVSGPASGVHGPAAQVGVRTLRALVAAVIADAVFVEVVRLKDVLVRGVGIPHGSAAVLADVAGVIPAGDAVRLGVDGLTFVQVLEVAGKVLDHVGVRAFGLVAAIIADVVGVEVMGLGLKGFDSGEDLNGGSAIIAIEHGLLDAIAVVRVRVDSRVALVPLEGIVLRDALVLADVLVSAQHADALGVVVVRFLVLDGDGLFAPQPFEAIGAELSGRAVRDAQVNRVAAGILVSGLAIPAFDAVIGVGMGAVLYIAAVIADTLAIEVMEHRDGLGLLTGGLLKPHVAIGAVVLAVIGVGRVVELGIVGLLVLPGIPHLFAPDDLVGMGAGIHMAAVVADAVVVIVVLDVLQYDLDGFADAASARLAVSVLPRLGDADVGLVVAGVLVRIFVVGLGLGAHFLVRAGVLALLANALVVEVVVLKVRGVRGGFGQDGVALVALDADGLRAGDAMLGVAADVDVFLAGVRVIDVGFGMRAGIPTLVAHGIAVELVFFHLVVGGFGPVELHAADGAVVVIDPRAGDPVAVRVVHVLDGAIRKFPIRISLGMLALIAAVDALAFAVKSVILHLIGIFLRAAGGQERTAVFTIRAKVVFVVCLVLMHGVLNALDGGVDKLGINLGIGVNVLASLDRLHVERDLLRQRERRQQERRAQQAEKHQTGKPGFHEILPPKISFGYFSNYTP